MKTVIQSIIGILAIIHLLIGIVYLFMNDFYLFTIAFIIGMVYTVLFLIINKN